MRIGVWVDGALRDSNIEDLRKLFKTPAWIDVTDPEVEDLQVIADTLEVQRQALVGKLRSNHSHVDASPEYLKIFAWLLEWHGEEKDYLFERLPVIALTNGIGIVTVSQSKSRIGESISRGIEISSYAHLSMHARVTYLFLRHLVGNYERIAEKFEATTENLEETIPPWPRQYYARSFAIKKEASALLRLTKHLRAMMDSLSRGMGPTIYTEDERRAFDVLYERAMGAEEMMEVSLDTIRDLISLHLDMVSYGMNKGMRLLAALTAVVGVSSVVAALLGMNLVDIPQLPLNIWEVVIIDLIASVVMIIFFYSRGWLGEK